jgi:hypothetical protein
MEKLLYKKAIIRSYRVSFFRHILRIGITKKSEIRISDLPYLINLFLISCSPAELIYTSIDNTNVKLL